MLSSKLINYKKHYFPSCIRYSGLVGSNVKLEKIFPAIGLSNCKEPIEHQFNFSSLKTEAIIHLAIKKFLEQFNRDKLACLKTLEMYKMSRVLYILDELNKRFNKPYGIEIKDNNVTLSTSIISYDNRALIKSGTDVYKLVKSLFALSSKYVKIELLDAADIKDKCKNLTIAFSSSELEGAWDIATMSMRGIKSCMRWEANQSTALVGSIADPCCGIIYLTNGEKTTYGSKMLFRSIVRLLVDVDTNQPALFIDRVYSSFYKSRPEDKNDLDLQAKELFCNWLKTKFPKTTILTYTDNKDRYIYYKYCIPAWCNAKNCINAYEQSYRDTPLEYNEYNGYEKLKSSIVDNIVGKSTDTKSRKSRIKKI